MARILRKACVGLLASVTTVSAGGALAATPESPASVYGGGTLGSDFAPYAGPHIGSNGIVVGGPGTVDIGGTAGSYSGETFGATGEGGYANQFLGPPGANLIGQEGDNGTVDGLVLMLLGNGGILRGGSGGTSPAIPSVPGIPGIPGIPGFAGIPSLSGIPLIGGFVPASAASSSGLPVGGDPIALLLGFADLIPVGAFGLPGAGGLPIGGDPAALLLGFADLIPVGVFSLPDLGIPGLGALPGLGTLPTLPVLSLPGL